MLSNVRFKKGEGKDIEKSKVLPDSEIKQDPREVAWPDQDF